MVAKICIFIILLIFKFGEISGQYFNHGILGLDNLKQLPSGEYLIELRDQHNYRPQAQPQVNNFHSNAINKVINSVVKKPTPTPSPSANELSAGTVISRDLPESPCPDYFQYKNKRYGLLRIFPDGEDHVHLVVLLTVRSQFSQVCIAILKVIYCDFQ
jgi:hypothetical protein